MIAVSSLDFDSVAAFVVVADMKSFTRAAEMLGTTQSAISLRLKRLEDRLGRRLLERTPRSVRLSADGAAFLSSARSLVEAHGHALASFGEPVRSLRLGVSDHLAGADLPMLLKALAASDPFLVIGLDIAPSRSVLEAYAAGAIDAAIVLRHDAQTREGLTLGQEPFAWVAMPDFCKAPPLRIATHTRACAVRALAVRALGEAGIAWTEAFTGGGLGAVAAAVTAGLAVAAMGRRTVPPGAIDVGARLGLPSLPSFDVVLHTGVSHARSRTALRTLAAAFTRGQP